MQLELNLNSIEEKWDANWYKRFSKFACNYGIGKKTFEKEKEKKEKKRHICILHHLRIEYTYSNLELYKGQLI